MPRAKFRPLRVSQAVSIGLAATEPGAVAADADQQQLAHNGQGILLALRFDPGILQSASFAKYADAFF
jgi:hypothetical protein